METVKIECPACEQAYSVEKKDLTKEATVFNCTVCGAKFYCKKNDLGFYTTLDNKKHFDEKMEAASTDQTDCPECGRSNSTSSFACDFCGLIFEKYRESTLTKPKVKIENASTGSENAGTGTEINASLEIMNQWEIVKDNYENMKEHDKFLEICLTQDLLSFASMQYKKLSEANPSDEIAKKMNTRVLNVVQAVKPLPAEDGMKFKLGSSGALALFGIVIVLLFSILGPSDQIKAVGVSAGVLLVTFGLFFRFVKR